MPRDSLTQFITEIEISTSGPGMIDFSHNVTEWLGLNDVCDGMLTVFVRHTSASLTIQENADPDVQIDLVNALDNLAPEHAGYRHNSEGPDDMPAHIKSAITSTSLSVPVKEGRMLLGTWQGLYLIEHRSQPHKRRVVAHFLGSSNKSLGR